MLLIERQDELPASIAAKKERLDAMRPVSREALLALQKSYDVDLLTHPTPSKATRSTLRETAELIEHGITVGGKPCAIILRPSTITTPCCGCANWRQRATPIDESTVRELHRRIVFRSQPEIGGILQHASPPHCRFSAVFPNPAKIPGLMKEYGEWLGKAEPDRATSFDAHFRLVAIHPFTDGNGRTARLLMNLLLLRAGYPPVAVRPEDRKTYLDTLEHASMREDLEPFQTFMYRRLDATLEEYLSALQEAQPRKRNAITSGPDPKP